MTELLRGAQLRELVLSSLMSLSVDRGEWTSRPGPRCRHKATEHSPVSFISTTVCGEACARTSGRSARSSHEGCRSGPAEHRDAAARTYPSEARANGPRHRSRTERDPGLYRNRSVLGGVASGLGA